MKQKAAYQITKGVAKDRLAAISACFSASAAPVAISFNQWQLSSP
jgi:hypothetical protein